MSSGLALSCPTIHCWESAQWERAVYLKKAQDNDINAIEMTHDTVITPEEWPQKTLFSLGSPFNLSHLGTLAIPKGRYVAHNKDLGKFYTVSEINGKKSSKSSGFWGEERGIVIFKAALVSLTGIVGVYTIVNIFLNSIRILLNGYNAMRTANFKISKAVIQDIKKIITQGMRSIVRIFLYAPALQAALLFTLISPYNGRRLVAKIENAWHYPCTLADDVLYNKNFKNSNFDDVLRTLNTKVCYLFLCFQPRRSYSEDPRYVLLRPPST